MQPPLILIADEVGRWFLHLHLCCKLYEAVLSAVNKVNMQTHVNLVKTSFAVTEKNLPLLFLLTNYCDNVIFVNLYVKKSFVIILLLKTVVSRKNFC